MNMIFNGVAGYSENIAIRIALPIKNAVANMTILATIPITSRYTNTWERGWQPL